MSPPLLPQDITMTEETEPCLACSIAFVPGDKYFPDVSGGFLHAGCCGPERESYVNADGEPLGPDDALPEPSIWED